MSFYALAQQCSPHFEEKQVMAAVADTESKFNPFGRQRGASLRDRKRSQKKKSYRKRPYRSQRR